MTSRVVHDLFSDLWRSLIERDFWLYYAWVDTLLRYRSMLLGPLWPTLSTAIFILLIGFLFGHVLDVPRSEFMKHLSVGYVLWVFILESVVQACTIFRENRPFILNGRIRYTDFILKHVTRVTIHFLHNLPVPVAIFIIFGLDVSFEGAVTSALAVIVFALNAIWVGAAVAIIGARWADLSEMLQSAMRFFFLASPIIWMVDEASGRGGVLGIFLYLNPFFHFLEVIRGPLMGHAVNDVSWLVVGSVTVVGLMIGAFIYRRFVRYVPLWV